MSYVVIVGGELHNKGAQAMTFTVVDQVKQKYPDKDVVLFANTYTDRDEKEKETLNFNVLPWNFRTKMKFLGFSLAIKGGLIEYIKYLIKGHGIPKEQISEINRILKNTDLMIDVSGYALSSQRGFRASLTYIHNIMIAKKFAIPMILFPQSFGPFNYSVKESGKIIPLIAEYLKYPKKIYAREYDGIKHLEQFSLKNIEKSFDCVLRDSKEFTISNIFKQNELNVDMEIKIPTNSVAIIPNQKIMVHGDQTAQYDTYRKIINRLLEDNRNIYLIRHSFEDLEICRKIKSEFQSESKVVLLEDDLNCVQMERILSQFDFLIASRYHSIIHAYNNYVPTLVFGWAIKYNELLSFFNQEKYLFDVRNQQNYKDIIQRLNDMMTNYQNESNIIRNKMKELPQKTFIN